MSVRIIAGKLAGRKIPDVKSVSTRPTTDAWRNATFSALENIVQLDGLRILDLCCGTGIFGLECLSRNAHHAVFVDHDASVCKELRLVVNEFSIDGSCEIIKDDALHFLNTTTSSFNIIFADPPYASRLCNRIESALEKTTVLRNNGLLICEHADSEVILPSNQFIKIWEKEKGGTVMEIFRRQAP